VRVFDQQVSLMEAASRLQLKARSILHVGAERFYLLALDEKGKYLQTSHSSSCAAGTGSFLDQQAVRLNLNDTGHLSDMALKNSSPIPDIAARCSVFAKTDLIHAQQKGYGLEAICDSLCKGLADNIADTLFNKSVPESPIYMSGGVSRNQSVVRHLQRIIGKEILIHPLSEHWPALGAAYLMLKELQTDKASYQGRSLPAAGRAGKPGLFLRTPAASGFRLPGDRDSGTVHPPACPNRSYGPCPGGYF
jgi:activator of 2-hydroxyglutaryl-CoA dehydratase